MEAELSTTVEEAGALVADGQTAIEPVDAAPSKDSDGGGSPMDEDAGEGAEGRDADVNPPGWTALHRAADDANAREITAIVLASSAAAGSSDGSGSGLAAVRAVVNARATDDERTTPLLALVKKGFDNWVPREVLALRALGEAADEAAKAATAAAAAAAGQDAGDAGSEPDYAARISAVLDLEARDGEGMTALQLCAENSWSAPELAAKLAHELLSLGADVDADRRHPPGDSAAHAHGDGCGCGLHVGAVLGALETVMGGAGGTKRKRGGAGSAPRQRFGERRTALHAACEQAAPGVVGVLVRADADPTVLDPDVGSPLHVLCGSRRWVMDGHPVARRMQMVADAEEVAGLLLDTWDDDFTRRMLLDLRDEDGYAPVHAAAMNAPPQVLKLVLDKMKELGADVDVLPATMGQLRKLEREKGMGEAQKTQQQQTHDEPDDDDASDADSDDAGEVSRHAAGMTPLLVACRYVTTTPESVDRIRLLLEAGASVHAVGGQAQTALGLACMTGSVAACRLLVAAGADVARLSAEADAQPLHVAATKGHADVCAWLVREAGCDVDALSTDGQRYTPLVNAAGYGGNAETVRVLVADLGADVEQHIYDGRRPLHFAAFKGQLDAARELVALGADVEAEDDNAWTPLHFAARYHHAELLRFLLGDAGPKAQVGKKVAGGPDYRAKDGVWKPARGFSAADLARTVHGGQECVDILLAAGDELGDHVKNVTDEDLWKDEPIKVQCCVM